MCDMSVAPCSTYKYATCIFLFKFCAFLASTLTVCIHIYVLLSTNIEVSNIALNLICRSEPLRAQRSTIVRSIPYSKQDVWSAPQSENKFKSFFLPSSPTGSY